MGDLFGKRPKVTPPAPMPDANDPAIKAAEDNTRRMALSRSGRASTNLAQSTNSGGALAYRNSFLGDS